MELIIKKEVKLSKKEELIQSIKNEDWSKALSIAKNFRREFTINEQMILQIANESKDQSRSNFYRSIGINVEDNDIKAIKILKNYK